MQHVGRNGLQQHFALRLILAALGAFTAFLL